MNIEFTDRYGGNPPSWLRGCFDQCEATGYVPIDTPPGYRKEKDKMQVCCIAERNEYYDKQWIKAEKESPAEDGWHFVKCSSCKGTGKVSWARTFLRVPRWIVKGIRFVFTAPNM